MSVDIKDYQILYTHLTHICDSLKESDFKKKLSFAVEFFIKEHSTSIKPKYEEIYEKMHNNMSAHEKAYHTMQIAEYNTLYHETELLFNEVKSSKQTEHEFSVLLSFLREVIRYSRVLLQMDY